MGNIYFATNKNTGVLRKHGDGLYVKETDAFNRVHQLLNDDLVGIVALDRANILFAAKSGFVHFDPEIQTSPQPFDITLQKISLITENDSVIGGAAKWQHHHLQIPNQHNSLKFDYSAHYFSINRLEYRLKLEGLDGSWSSWSDHTEKEYTNLDAGKYTLYTQARNLQGDLGEMQPFTFTVLPPWYLNTTAKAIYFLLILIALIAAIWWIRARLHLHARRLEISQKRELIQKDNQIKQAATQSKEEIDKLQKDKLQSEVKHKGQELALSTMNLISKNEFIAQLKARIRNIAKQEADDKLSQDLQRIIKEIDRNLNQESDWHQFAFHFDQVHGDFLKKIKIDNPSLTPQEVKLCAYLRMNMSTKEIANLLSISVRGVEVSRYRLRKKLQLETQTNLSEYIMGY